ncbi:glycosyltransferase family 4 protein (plasmid) [Streptomyces viridifaciens]|nr:glycosyltransferase family 4 protein [Streptomyces viridifaciens]
MKILVSISDQVWGGKHRYMVDAITGMLADGHRVLPVVEEGGKVVAELERRGLPCIAVPPFATDPAAAAAALAPILSAPGEIDVVCVTGRHDAAAVRQALSEGDADPMVVFYRHSAFPLDDDGDAQRLLRRADLVISTSWEQADRQFGSSAKLSGDVVVIPSAVEREFIDLVAGLDARSVRSDLSIGEDTFVFTVPARLSWEKGVDRVVRAMPKVGDPTEEAVLLVVGDGPERSKLEELVTELDLSDRVIFTGHVTDMAPILAASDAVVLASIVPETGPLALKEAMGAGKPVVASRTGGIPEFITNGVSGLLVEDDDELVHAMNMLLADPARSGQLGRHAQEAILCGHLQEHRRCHLMRCLDRQAIRSLPLENILPELRWSDVRVRREKETGFVFVPATSQISELSLSCYRSVEAAVAADNPMALLDLTADQVRDVTGLLYDMGALVPNREGARL